MSGANGLLRAVLDQACAEQGLPAKDLTVLAVQRDPYRLDTPAGHRDGAWLAGEMERLGLLDRDAIALGNFHPIHLRGLHYALVSAEVVKPDGTTPYTNTDRDWTWLQEGPAKAARWLGHVPFEALHDARNAEPVVRPHEAPSPTRWVEIGVHVEIPRAWELEPRIGANFSVRQPYRQLIFGEKTSLEPVLAPVATRFGADLYLPAGEISDTLLHTMARTGHKDGRPMIVHVIADFDPAGHQMGVSIGRKLQALRDLLFPVLTFEVHRVALTREQVLEFGLPSTPLKETERRADRWRAAMGAEQTEVDALATLRPELLERIATAALEAFHDPTLALREREAEWAWQREAQKAFDAQVDGDALDAIRSQAAEKLEQLREDIDALNEALRGAVPDDIELPEMKVPEPAAVDGEVDAKPLVRSDWPWADQTRALIDQKRYGEDAP